MPAGVRLLLFGGKGGVGKTTCAAARAIADARAGRRVLVLSTDPAHSLADALGVRLASRPKRIPLTRAHDRRRPAAAVPDRRAAFVSPRSGRRVARSASAGDHSPGELWAAELNGPRAFAGWLAHNRRALGDVVEHGTWLDRQDVDTLLELPIPGVDELMALIDIVRVASADSRYDTVIVDTAPTGHTLRLLAAPDTVSAVAGVLDELQEEHRVIRARFGRGGRPEAADLLIETLARQARESGELLRDAARTAFHLVTLPEPLAVAETADALAALARARIGVAGLIVNRVLPAGPACRLCDPRRAAERRVLPHIRRLAGRRPLRLLAARAVEPRGTEALAAIGEELTAARRRSPVVVRGSTVSQRATVRRATAILTDERRTESAERTSPERLDPFVGARLLFFGGKGGVGKTTCAAAAAIRLAASDPSRRVLLLSTDPAHSLGDVLGVTLGDRPRRVPTGPHNLSARELDARHALATHRAAIEAAVHDVTAPGAAADAAWRGVGDLMDLAPPGIDELLGVISVVESLGLDAAAAAPPRVDRTIAAEPAEQLQVVSVSGGAVVSAWPGARPSHAPDTANDLVVCDTAPTGHALRLLELPDEAREWVQALMRMLLKYREVVRPGRLAQELVELSHSIRRLRDLLRDRVACRFIVVTRAADVPRLETERLIARLRTLSIAVPAVVVNAATLDPGACPWCTTVAAAERRVVDALARTATRRSQPCAIIETPLVVPPPRGVAPLRRWAGRWVAPRRP